MKTKQGIQRIGLMILSLTLTVAVSDAKPDKGKGNGKHANKAETRHGKPDKGKASGKVDKRGGKPSVKLNRDGGRQAIARFRPTDREVVLGYFSGYRDREHGLPPGLAKNLRRGKALPSGWRNKLEAGYVIDDGWWPSFSPVSYELFPGIPVREDVGLYWYGDRIVRVYEPRREVIEVIVVPTIHIDF
ncbi:hypothetical protein [Luteolibacter marinus]|uniref:hypothetical protein n=1 Tax=Luteolibacter marinus TaxID=2776705 RepID=UPI001866B087|nr:hypothetical protein [Luteolibacter marinus]